ncbi:GMP reductase [Vibrio cholerae]|nr:GMP reductase [Vibrio cholerae]CSC62030.1 GMP reductase [Vibrio cholerae]CSC86262.1 GMP reductase [Vibrio cholerae]CSC90865.1 GMP reductase [Vibrio cholerae]
MDSVGSFAMAKALAEHGVMTAVHKHYTVADWAEFVKSADKATLNNVMVSTGTSEADFQKTKDVMALSDELIFICIDIANGYSEHLVEYVQRVRAAFPDKVISAGNVVTGDMVEELILAGADIVKVGIGPGSVCTTRVKTGVGYPQLSAIIECADAAHGLGGRIIGDGGCTCPGDVAKAFGGGADFVMLGGMLAGHEEAGGELIVKDGETFMKFYGMSSKSAMDKHSGGVAGYRAAEGKTVLLPYRGSVHGTIQDILGGVRSTCTYVGAAELRELTKRTTFIRVQEQENNVYGRE